MGVVIYWERDLYLGCDRSSGHRTKMGKGPDGSDGGCELLCDSISIHEAKGERDKTRQRARQGIKLEAVFHSGPRVRGGFVLPCQTSQSAVSRPLTFFFFFFFTCICTFAFA